MFESHRRYLASNSDDVSDVDYEDEKIAQSIDELCEYRKEAKATKKGGTKSVLSKAKLMILFEKHSLKKTKQEVMSFIQEVHELVSRLLSRLSNIYTPLSSCN